MLCRKFSSQLGMVISGQGQCVLKYHPCLMLPCISCSMSPCSKQIQIGHCPLGMLTILFSYLPFLPPSFRLFFLRTSQRQDSGGSTKRILKLITKPWELLPLYLLIIYLFWCCYCLLYVQKERTINRAGFWHYYLVSECNTSKIPSKQYSNSQQSPLTFFSLSPPSFIVVWLTN